MPIPSPRALPASYRLCGGQRKIAFVLVLLLVSALLGLGAGPRRAAASGATAGAGESIYARWQQVLAAYVDDEGLVDYAGLKERGSDDLKAFMDTLAQTDPAAFSTDAERMAFWINAYNAVVVWQAVERYPIDSVRDVGALWGLVGGFFKNKYPIAGTQMSADNIEHDTLRAKFKDARIHWALVCGAFGCPRLLNRPYLPETLEQQLAAQTHEFLRQPCALQLDRDTGTLYLSSYFKWYEGDFEADSGTVVDYVLGTAPDEVVTYIEANRDGLRVRIMDYDWALNDQRKGPRARRPIPR